MAIDPVCGMEIDDNAIGKLKIISVHKNKKFYFCSNDCRSEFNAAPEDYITAENPGIDTSVK